MENNKKGNGLVIFLIIIMIVFASLTILLGTGVLKSPFVKCEECKDTTVTVSDDKIDTTNTTIETVIDDEKNNVNESAQTVETDEEKIKRLFIEKKFKSSENSDLLAYTIEEVEILTGSKKQEIVDVMGYKSTDILAYVTYSVKVVDNTNSDWAVGNGIINDVEKQWIYGKVAAVVVRDGNLISSATGF